MFRVALVRVGPDTEQEIDDLVPPIHRREVESTPFLMNAWRECIYPGARPKQNLHRLHLIVLRGDDEGLIKYVLWIMGAGAPGEPYGACLFSGRATAEETGHLRLVSQPGRSTE